ncbi:Alpha/beta-Hydrolases superfamily protein isoform 2 [Hibiscus syriacus]|uniref:Alpha/beta-Hydrolases superfamily protein isoform 2 n=1 Tax=Hibiscus syriacus TaxID=106335 RepID=A0A6A2XEW7_HIBSY|nr:Alpha/beta-Hydrolases superfamily protein isoform 2 [Hibiscus syriacus]
MVKCFSFTATRDSCFPYSFSNVSLRSSTTVLGDGTVMHVWVLKSHSQSKPTLALIHGFGVNAMWQWNDFVSPIISRFKVYVPDLLFFSGSYTTRPERSEQFQARCVIRVMEALGVVTAMNVVGISYGGFVDKDIEEGMFKVENVDEAVDILLAQKPDKLRELMKISFHKPTQRLPSCFLKDFIHVMCTEHYEERKELILVLHKDKIFRSSKHNPASGDYLGRTRPDIPFGVGIQIEKASGRECRTSDHKECRACRQCRETQRATQAFDIRPY